MNIDHQDRYMQDFFTKFSRHISTLLHSPLFRRFLFVGVTHTTFFRIVHPSDLNQCLKRGVIYFIPLLKKAPGTPVTKEWWVAHGAFSHLPIELRTGCLKGACCHSAGLKDGRWRGPSQLLPPMFCASPPAYETNLCDPVMIEMDTYKPITMEIDTDDLDAVIVHHTTHSESQSTHSDTADANKMLAIQKASCLRRPTAPLC